MKTALPKLAEKTVFSSQRTYNKGHYKTAIRWLVSNREQKRLIIQETANMALFHAYQSGNTEMLHGLINNFSTRSPWRKALIGWVEAHSNFVWMAAKDARNSKDGFQRDHDKKWHEHKYVEACESEISDFKPKPKKKAPIQQISLENDDELENTDDNVDESPDTGPYASNPETQDKSRLISLIQDELNGMDAASLSDLLAQLKIKDVAFKVAA